MSEASEIVDGRESTYGHPWDDFTTIRQMHNVWDRRYRSAHPFEGIESDYNECVKHVVYLMIVKLVRLSKTPTHYDSILDLGGYAETLMRCYKRAFGEGGIGGPSGQTAIFKKVPLDEMRHRIMMAEREKRPIGDVFIGGPIAEDTKKGDPVYFDRDEHERKQALSNALTAVQRLCKAPGREVVFPQDGKFTFEFKYGQIVSYRADYLNGDGTSGRLAPTPP